MDASDEDVRAKRGCLWYVGVGIVGVIGSLGILVAVLLLSPREPNQHSIVVSAANQTYLEVAIVQEPDGFPDWHYELQVYYVKLGGWFSSTQRLLVYANDAHSLSPESIRLTRSDEGPSTPIEVVDQSGQVLFVFHPTTASFSDFRKANPQYKVID